MREAPDSLTLLSLVAAEMGVTITLSALQFFQPEGLVYRKLKTTIPVDSVVAWHENNTSKSLPLIVELIKQLASEEH